MPESLAYLCTLSLGTSSSEHLGDLKNDKMMSAKNNHYKANFVFTDVNETNSRKAVSELVSIVWTGLHAWRIRIDKSAD